MRLKIFILFSIFFFLFSTKAQAAVLFSQSANQDVYEGQTFVLDWFMDTEGKPINSFDLKLNFSKDVLRAEEASTGNSLISLWIKYPSIDNNTGEIALTGGIPNGANNDRIPVFRSVFKAIKTGTASITLDPDSKVLLNDGQGTAEQLKFMDELFNVYPEEFMPVKITSSTHPDQNSWSSNRDVAIKFTKKAGTDYSYSFSSNIEIIPNDQIHEIPEVFIYKNLPDGIYYFKLNLKAGSAAWQEAGVYRIQIDATPPESFRPLIASDPSVFEGGGFVSFSTLDKMSGISYYKVKVGLFGELLETQTPYKLYKPFVGDYVTVTAYDNAGNSRTETVSWPGYLSVSMFKLILILIGLVAIAVYLITRRKIAAKQK